MKRNRDDYYFYKDLSWIERWDENNYIVYINLFDYDENLHQIEDYEDTIIVIVELNEIQ